MLAAPRLYGSGKVRSILRRPSCGSSRDRAGHRWRSAITGIAQPVVTRLTGAQADWAGRKDRERAGLMATHTLRPEGSAGLRVPMARGPGISGQAVRDPGTGSPAIRG